MENTKDEVKCPKCGGTTFLILEYILNKADFNEDTQSLDVYSTKDNMVELISCYNCELDLTKELSEYEINWM